MSILYVTDAGMNMEKNGNRILVKQNGEPINSVPLEKLEGVVMLGRTHVTSPLLMELLEREVPLTYLSSTGKFFGRLESTQWHNIERQREQFRRGDDPEFSLDLAKSFIQAKIHNCAVILRRQLRISRNPEVEEAVKKLDFSEEQAGKAVTIEQLMGHEGNASKIYFRGLGQIVPHGFGFKRRTRQPPEDPFNSLLSFGYTLLLYEIYTAIINKGLHPYASFLHQIRRGHPALASDLIEEWRPVIVDSLALKLVTGNDVVPEDFQEPDDGGGVYLQRDSAKVFIRAFENRMRIENKYLTYIDYSVSFRESLAFQAGCLARAIEEKDPSIYRPVRIR